MAWDLFLSHAAEDKDVADPLATMFRDKGLRIWYDRFELKLGDSLRRKIDEGLAGSEHGLVLLSPRFFVKNWPRKELDGLVARADGSKRRILPVWHQLRHADVARYSPILADLVSVSTDAGLDQVVRAVFMAIRPAGPEPAETGRTHSRGGRRKDLPTEALYILREAAQGEGLLHTSTDLEGVHIQADRRFLDDPDDPGSGLRCVAHLRRLVALGYLSQLGETDFEVTRAGYAYLARME